MVVGDPIAQQIIELRIEMLVGRVPGLQEEIVDISLVDGADGGVGVGVSRKQGALGIGKDLLRLFQKAHSVHAGHALVDEKQCDPIVAQLQLAKDVESLLRSAAADDSVIGAVLRAQITLNRPQYVRIVIDTQQNRLAHDGCPKDKR